MSALSPQAVAQSVIDELQRRRAARLVARSTRSPRTTVVASDIPDCDRQLDYSVQRWQDREPFDAWVSARLEVGNEEEKRVTRELEQYGVKVVEGNLPFEVKNRAGKVVIRGKIDGKAQLESDFLLAVATALGVTPDELGRVVLPFEVKSMAPTVFESVDEYADLQRTGWLRRYARQIQVYLYATNAEVGLYLLTDCLGHWKLFVVSLDYEATETILQRVEQAESRRQAGVLADPIPYDAEQCGKCPFRHICLPDRLRQGMRLIDDAELEARLNRRAELAPVVKEYNALDGEIKEVAKLQWPGQSAVVGSSWMVRVSTTTKKAYTVPENTFPTVRIERLKDAVLKEA